MAQKILPFISCFVILFWKSFQNRKVTKRKINNQENSADKTWMKTFIVWFVRRSKHGQHGKIYKSSSVKRDPKDPSWQPILHQVPKLTDLIKLETKLWQGHRWTSLRCEAFHGESTWVRKIAAFSSVFTFVSDTPIRRGLWERRFATKRTRNQCWRGVGDNEGGNERNCRSRQIQSCPEIPPLAE